MIISKLLVLNNIFILAVIFISVDGFPYFPANSDNRPISNLILPFYFSFSIIWSKFRFDKFEIKAFFVFFVAFFFTLIKAQFVYHDFDSLIKFALTGTLTIITLISTRRYFFYLLNRFGSLQDVLNYLAQLLLISTILPIGLGIIQLFGVLGVLPISFSERISLLFIYRFNSIERLQFLNQEPFSAALYFGFVFIFFHFFAKQSKVKILYLGVLFFCFLLTSSTAGFISVFLTFLISQIVLLQRKKFLSFVSITILILFVSIFVVFLVVNFGGEYTLAKFSVLYDVYNSEISFLDLVSLDFSIADRTVTPIIPFYSILDTYGLGAGGESFKYIYANIVYSHFPELTNNVFFNELLTSNLLTTPKMLLSKLIGDFGLIGGGLFIYFIFRMIKRLKEIGKLVANTISKKLVILFIFGIINTQLCSYYNFTNIFIFTLIFIYVSGQEKINLKAR